MRVAITVTIDWRFVIALVGVEKVGYAFGLLGG
jgi:hypothetical protein